MAFLNKKERITLNAINSNQQIHSKTKAEAVSTINYYARLRSDGHSKSVRMFLSALADVKINSIAEALVK